MPNGYISEDEGLGSVQQSLNDLCADLEGAHPRPRARICLAALRCQMIYALSALSGHGWQVGVMSTSQYKSSAACSSHDGCSDLGTR